MASDDSAQVFPPPPRIAARFYRPSKARRRSSAASSRRNSISSAHSHHSHHSHHSYHGPHSSHIAQHLRRASILESRKARLADRAAHAEKVRLRAALAKATPRISSSEDRALAAEKARQKYLAQVAAGCAEEVKRAKRVAEDMKERRALEGRKLREEMKERLAEAERRRAEYQRQVKRGRTTSLPRGEDKKVLREIVTAVDQRDAVVKIQHAWKTARRRRVIRDFHDLGLSIEGVCRTSFDAVGALLAQEKVVRHTADVLHLCGLHDTETGASGEKTAVRTFLSAFLVLGHPAEVLSNDGEQEQDLVTKSKDLLIYFEQLLLRTTSSNSYTPPPMAVQRFTEAYHTFLSAFSAWKAHDSSALLQIMLAQYVELDQIWQTIKDEPEEAVKAEYREGIRENQILLLVRIKRLAGPEKAKVLIRDATRTARRSRNKKSVEDRGPRVAPAVSTTSASSGKTTATVLEQPGDPQPLVAGIDGDPSPGDDLARVMSVIPDNRTLAHEVALNQGYRVQSEFLATSEPRAALKKAIFDGMRIDVQNGHDQQWIVAMAVNIKSRLLRLLTPGNSLYVLISEALDPAVIARDCAMGSFSYEKFFSFMISILPRLCAPFRDTDVKALADQQDGDIIDRLARLIHVIDLLSLDYANYLLQESAPRLIQEAPAYEERCFAQDLDHGTTSLQRLKSWWNDAKEKALAEAMKRDPDGINHPANKPTSGRIYMRGLTNLFICVAELQGDDVPETLDLDRERIAQSRADTLRIIAVGSILLTAKNLLKRDVRSPWKAEAVRIWEILKDDAYDEASTTSIQSTLESSHALPASTKTQLGNLIARITSQSRSRQLTDPVMKLLYNRVKTHVYNRLIASSSSNANASQSGSTVTGGEGAGGGLAASGLPEFVERITEMGEEMKKVADVDRQSHGRWYEVVAAAETSTTVTSTNGQAEEQLADQPRA